jgi:hypothetical protein
MLYTLAVVLIILWLLGMVSSYTMGGFIHILLVIAIIMVLVNLIGGRSRMHIATTDNHFIPPVVGALALVGGIVLLLVKPRRV